eukprot:CAMPEP_0170644490 /NCGR_PEP_ID=MMETSP0224-20130122/42513_1 /TAXON_ID=285029 /ORGANISM="Togula jolla, Strain CCCM 725" /LENGTH=171 /DNA_ID=CAMNT_0010975521 /DNA_START=87 /DNA_END=599 /DNA_ORIENTATION=+
MRNDDAIVGHLVDLRCSDGVVRVGIERVVHLAGEVARRTWLKERLHLEKARDGCSIRSDNYLREVGEKAAACLPSLHIPASADSRVCVEDLHAGREHRSKMFEKLLGLRARVLHRHHQAHLFRKFRICACWVSWRHWIRNSWERNVAEKSPRARRIENATHEEGEQQDNDA